MQFSLIIHKGCKGPISKEIAKTSKSHNLCSAPVYKLFPRFKTPIIKKSYFQCAHTEKAKEILSFHSFLLKTPPQQRNVTLYLTTQTT